MAEEETKIIQFNKQLDLPLVWWSEPKLWSERYLASTIERPTEDEALENIHNAAKVKSGKMKAHVGKIEKRIYMLELQSFRDCPRWFNEVERQQWIAKQTGYSILEIREILASVDTAIFRQSLIDEAEKSHRELVREVMAEVFPYFERAA